MLPRKVSANALSMASCTMEQRVVMASSTCHRITPAERHSITDTPLARIATLEMKLSLDKRSIASVTRWLLTEESNTKPVVLKEVSASVRLEVMLFLELPMAETHLTSSYPMLRRMLIEVEPLHVQGLTSDLVQKNKKPLTFCNVSVSHLQHKRRTIASMSTSKQDASMMMWMSQTTKNSLTVSYSVWTTACNLCLTTTICMEVLRMELNAGVATYLLVNTAS